MAPKGLGREHFEKLAGVGPAKPKAAPKAAGKGGQK
jgi:hypothetical protein